MMGRVVRPPAEARPLRGRPLGRLRGTPTADGGHTSSISSSVIPGKIGSDSSRAAQSRATGMSAAPSRHAERRLVGHGDRIVDAAGDRRSPPA